MGCSNSTPLLNENSIGYSGTVARPNVIPEGQRLNYNDIRNELINNPNIERAVFHNINETTFIGHNKEGRCVLAHIQHPNYNSAFLRFVVPMVNNFNRGNLIADQ